MSVCVIRDPHSDDGYKADRDEDNVNAEQQTVDHYPDHLPFLRGFAPLEVFVYLKADGHEISAQLPQFLQGRLRRTFLRRSVVVTDALKIS